MDSTFRPEAAFVRAPPAANASSMDGFPHFGEVEVTPGGEELRVTLRAGRRWVVVHGALAHEVRTRS